MTHPISSSQENHVDHDQEVYSKTLLGFWIYLLTDFVVFATLFATYMVLHNNTFGGPSAKELFDLPFTLAQTLILLTSSFTIGVASTFVHKNHKGGTFFFFGITFLLGLFFTWMQWAEFSQLVTAGDSWQKSAFLSAFFTLVGTHWIHMILGLLWILVFILPVFRYGLTPVHVRRLTCLKMFWQFLNVVWVFIFTVVYLLGVVG